MEGEIDCKVKCVCILERNNIARDDQLKLSIPLIWKYAAANDKHLSWGGLSNLAPWDGCLFSMLMLSVNALQVTHLMPLTNL